MSTVAEAKSLLSEGYNYLDARTPEEHQAGRIPGSVNVPVQITNPAGEGRVPNPDFVAQVEAAFPDKAAKLVVGCMGGARGPSAVELLHQAGYQNAVCMKPGYKGWVAAGESVEDGSGRL